MTRENKLALVLGFGLMLFVGILVSDHLAARQSPLTAAIVASRAEVGVPPLPPPGTDEHIIITDANGTRETVPPPAPVVGPNGLRGDGRQDLVNNMPGQGSGVPESAVALVKTYQVKSGDTLEAIAQREYGSKKSLGKALATFNNMNPEKLKVGATVKLPALAELDPAAVVVRADGTPSPTPSLSPAPESPRFKVYKVQQGDTLFRIALRELGKGDRWKELQSSNTDIIKSGDDLTPGMQIKIPVMTASAARSTDA